MVRVSLLFDECEGLLRDMCRNNVKNSNRRRRREIAISDTEQSLLQAGGRLDVPMPAKEIPLVKSGLGNLSAEEYLLL